MSCQWSWRYWVSLLLFALWFPPFVMSVSLLAIGKIDVFTLLVPVLSIPAVSFLFAYMLWEKKKIDDEVKRQEKKLDEKRKQHES